MRVYNPRNKTAGSLGSPVHDIFALISYLIDPVRVRRIPSKSKAVEVYATHREEEHREHADALHRFFVADAHAKCQKKFRKSGGGGLHAPAPHVASLLEYIDNIRSALLAATEKHQLDPEGHHGPVLTLPGLVARLLSFEQFRNCGYTTELFRQALLTSLVESHVAPSRRTRRSLDNPMWPSRDPNTSKIDWPQEYWQFLNHFGSVLTTTSLDDVEVEAFADNAIAMLTFHQAKGLEFDHVYIGCTGRTPSPNNALTTELFSGRTVPFVIKDGHVETTDANVLDLAAADRDREVYVAMTRAKQTLTFLYDQTDTREMMQLNPGLEAIFEGRPSTPHSRNPAVQVKRLPAPAVITGGVPA